MTESDHRERAVARHLESRGFGPEVVRAVLRGRAALGEFRATGLMNEAGVAGCVAAWRSAGDGPNPRLVWNMKVSEDSPTIRGTAMTVERVVFLVIASGKRWADVLAAHPDLTEDDIRACLEWAEMLTGLSCADGGDAESGAGPGLPVEGATAVATVTATTTTIDAGPSIPTDFASRSVVTIGGR